MMDCEWVRMLPMLFIVIGFVVGVWLTNRHWTHNPHETYRVETADRSYMVTRL